MEIVRIIAEIMVLHDIYMYIYFYFLGVLIILCSGCWDYFYVLGVEIIFMFWVLGLFEWNV